jgi:hypothetical protein
VTVCEAVGGQIVNVPVFPPVAYGSRVEVVHALEALTEKVCVPMESPERVTGVLKPESMAFGPRAAMSGLAPGMVGRVEIRAPSI